MQPGKTYEISVWMRCDVSDCEGVVHLRWMTPHSKRPIGVLDNVEFRAVEE